MVAEALHGAQTDSGAGADAAPPARLRLVDDLAATLADAILGGQLRPGERLVETRLCDHYGVSRTTLREALLTLQRQGLVRSEPRRGTFVHRLSRAESFDLRRARSVLEGYAISAGHAALGPDDHAEMQAIVERMAHCEFPRDTALVIRLDLAFHAVIMRAVPSPTLHELWRSLDGRMSALILSSIERHQAETPDFAHFHQVLLDAIRSAPTAVVADAVVAHYIGGAAGDDGSLADTARAIGTMASGPPASGPPGG
jgi:DNA-binding GntR family transcriptional regulator